MLNSIGNLPRSEHKKTDIGCAACLAEFWNSVNLLIVRLEEGGVKILFDDAKAESYFYVYRFSYNEENGLVNVVYYRENLEIAANKVCTCVEAAVVFLIECIVDLEPELRKGYSNDILVISDALDNCSHLMSEEHGDAPVAIYQSGTVSDPGSELKMKQRCSPHRNLLSYWRKVRSNISECKTVACTNRNSKESHQGVKTASNGFSHSHEASIPASISNLCNEEPYFHKEACRGDSFWNDVLRPHDSAENLEQRAHTIIEPEPISPLVCDRSDIEKTAQLVGVQHDKLNKRTVIFAESLKPCIEVPVIKERSATPVSSVSVVLNSVEGEAIVKEWAKSCVDGLSELFSVSPRGASQLERLEEREALLKRMELEIDEKAQLQYDDIFSRDRSLVIREDSIQLREAHLTEREILVSSRETAVNLLRRKLTEKQSEVDAREQRLMRIDAEHQEIRLREEALSNRLRSAEKAEELLKMNSKDNYAKHTALASAAEELERMYCQLKFKEEQLNNREHDLNTRTMNLECQLASIAK